MYCYDALHRMTGKGYGVQSCPLASPVVTYAYDSGANAIGKLTSLTDQAGTASYMYDSLGRIANEIRVISGVSKSMSYSYNLDGSLKTLTNPSGAVITYTPDSAGHILSAVDGGNGINYVTGASYGPDSSLTGYVNGSGGAASITNTFTYNKRLQPLAMSAATASQTVYSLGYDFHLGNGDNGNVFGITNNKDTSRNQSFTYDALNRLTSAQNAGTNCAATTANGKTEYWGNIYGYDAWGNLLAKTVTKCSAENFSVAALANNQLSGYSYDAAGNMTNDPTDGITLNYDQENRLTGAAGYAYTYDGDGNRVKKSNGTTGTLYWYMTPGIVGESDLSGNLTDEYIFFDGERVARKDFPGGAVSYYFSDHLKTASVITDTAGNIKAESDYYPWGGELQFTNNDSNHFKFGGHEQDSESGLYNYGARSYSSGLSRFVSADWSAVPVPVPYAHFDNPQSLNLYILVGNNPLSVIDQDGHGWICISCAAESLKKTVDDHPRVMQALKGAGQVIIGGVGLGLSATAEAGSGGFATVGVIFAVQGSTATAVAGFTNIIGAATKTDVTGAEKGLAAVSNPAGQLVTAATGSLDKGAQASAISDALVTGANIKDLSEGSTITQTVKTSLALQSAQEGVKAVKEVIDAEPKTNEKK